MCMKNEEWKEYKLGEICCKIGSGATPSGGKEAYKGGDYNLIRSQNVLDFCFSADGLAQINDEQAQKLNNVELQENDVLINITGDSVARACVVPNWVLPGRVNQHVAIMRAKAEKLDYRYLLYFLQQQKKQLLTLASGGATRNALTKQMLEDYPINLPPLAIQEKIANILSALDDKIEINNAINRNLEEQAQALFKNWFVDFEPFGSEKPDDWQIGKLSDIAEYEKQKINISELTEETYYSTENMLPNRGGICRAANLPSIDQTTKCFPGETIISNIRPYFKKIFYCTEEIAGCSTDVLCFKPKKKTLEAYNYFLLCSDNFFDYMIKGAKGTKMPRGDKSQIMNYEVNIPSENMLQKFEAIASPILQQIKANQQENRHLAAVRDELLPKLMSGELYSY